MIPAFYGLLPEPHNTEICKLIVAALEFHTLAKLRLHTEHTIADLEQAIVTYGRLVRRFAARTCPAFNTKDTPKEAEAKARRKAKKAANSGDSSAGTSTRALKDNSRTFSLSRFKFGAIGGYPATIRSIGASENSSTLRVCYFAISTHRYR